MFGNMINKSRIKSPWVVHFDCGSCNGCDIEVLACLTPLYDIERFGIINVGNPKHADVLLVTGTVNNRNKHVLKNIYDQMPGPKAVIAMAPAAARAASSATPTTWSAAWIRSFRWMSMCPAVRPGPKPSSTE